MVKGIKEQGHENNLGNYMYDKYAIINMETDDEISMTLKAAFNAIPDYCFFSDDGQCEGPIVDGHIVQEARQRLFAERGMVMTFDQPPFHVAIELMERGKLQIPRLLKHRVATTERFTCEKHDRETFAGIEQRDININALDEDLEQLLNLMAYKSACGYFAKTRKGYLAWRRTLAGHPHDPMVNAANFLTYHNLKKAWEMVSHIEMVMNPHVSVNMAHEVTETGSKPILAANTCYPLTNPVEIGTKERLIGFWTTKAVTAYPTQARQMVITSFLQHPPTNSPVQVKRLGDSRPEERHMIAMTASAWLIQECESITMSPSAWSAIPEHKRQAISNYSIACNPGVPKEIQQAVQPPFEWLNLFGTSPFGP